MAQSNERTDNQSGAAATKSESTQQQSGTQSQALQGSQRNQQGGSIQRAGERGLARYSRDPFAMMQQLSEDMDRLFDSFFYGAPMRRAGRGFDMPSLWSPEVEMKQEGNQLRVCVDLPGVPKDDVKIDIHEGVLTIEGERREEHTEGGGEQGMRRTERRYGSFYRSIALPEGVDSEQAQARMKDGVLEITLPITEQKGGRRLEIQG